MLALVTTTPNVRAALASFAPQYPGYAALKAKLAEMRPEQSAVAPPQVPQGKVLRPNMSDPRVPILRARLGLPGEADNLVYDHDLVEAVKAFQAKTGQPPSGIIGKGTISAMNDTGERRVGDIIANMERWRWLPHEMAQTYVMVNIPEFMVRIVKDGKLFHETKVVVGKPENQTPLLTHDMEYIVFNPSWNVPPGIARKEMLPRLAADPYYLARQGIDVVRNGRVVDPGMVDWSRGTQGYAFRQPPGERNALGRIKFMFPNKHSVYLHDTPSRSLFANDRRAYSHGCVRVFEPLKFGEAIFALGMPQDPWSQGRISKQLGGSEKYVNLKQRFPVHLVYFTTFVNEAGALVSARGPLRHQRADQADARPRRRPPHGRPAGRARPRRAEGQVINPGSTPSSPGLCRGSRFPTARQSELGAEDEPRRLQGGDRRSPSAGHDDGRGALSPATVQPRAEYRGGQSSRLFPAGDAARQQFAAALQHRIGGRGDDVAVDQLHVAQEVEIERARLRHRQPVVAQALEMLQRGAGFRFAERHLLVRQQARGARILGHEERGRRS